MKKCNVCRQRKPLSDFYVHKTSPDGHGYTCKVCSRDRSRRWNAENKDRVNANGRRYWATHADAKNAARRQALQTDEGRAKRAEQRRKWYEDPGNRERSQAATKRWLESPEGKAWRADYMARTKDRRREHHLRARYGLDLETYEAMIAQQGGVCAICGEVPEQWAVDHDHACCSGANSCGECIRGLLCQRCNRGLASYDDSPDRLRAAAAYLESPPGKAYVN